MAQLLGSGYHFKRIRILKDQELGNGSYGMVCKALCDELLCAAKLLHPVIVSERNVQKFHQECQILSGLKHPNIIQYLGTHYDGPTSCQVLLMELMEESLTSFLERSAPPLPFHTEVNICHDISLALAYLHSNDIIHRDLSSNNVLLTADKRAKVTDFGMSRLADTSARLSTLTQAPGCYVYMSPEALAHTPKYSKKLDIFSMGVLIIQILTCKYPSPGSPTKKVVDQRYPVPIEVPVIETVRRKAHIDLVNSTHPLLKHACACLSYEDKERPTAQEMCYAILELEKSDRYLKAKYDSEGALEKLQCQLKETKEELAKMVDVIFKKPEEISRMSDALTKANEDISRKNKVILEKDEENFKKDQLLQRLYDEQAKKEQCLKVEQNFSTKEKQFYTGILTATSYDLSSIIAAVSTIPGQWRELGSGLGLQPVVLGAIHGPPEVCMVEVIKHWTHEAMAASRQRLSSALVRMGRTDLAEGVMAGVERDFSDFLRHSQEEAPCSPVPIIAQVATTSSPSLKLAVVKQLYVQALFDYDASKDDDCPSQGLSFKHEDILHILNGSDKEWWLAAAINSQAVDGELGLVPSTKRIKRHAQASQKNVRFTKSTEPSGLDRNTSEARRKFNLSMKLPFIKVSNTSVASSMQQDEPISIEEEHIATYKPVRLERRRYARPVIVLGPFKEKIAYMLEQEFPEKCAGCTPHTTRPPQLGEVDGHHYHFVQSVEQMEKDIQAHLFIEFGRYKDNIYGTSLKAVQEVIEQDKHCILNASGYVIRRLQMANLCPIAICIRPNTWKVIHAVTKANQEQCQQTLEKGAKIEQEFAEYLTAVVSGDSVNSIYASVKNVIQDQSETRIWVPTNEPLP